MQKDIRSTSAFQDMESYYKRLYQPGFGQVSYASNPAVAPNGEQIAAEGSVMTALEGVPKQIICLIDVGTGNLVRVTDAEYNSASPRWSPCGRLLSYLSDEVTAGIFLPTIKDAISLESLETRISVDGIVEYISWSPSGAQLLLGVAGFGAELAGMQGATTTKAATSELPSWMPRVESGFAPNEWRSLWVYDLERKTCQRISGSERNVWEASWLTDDELLVVVSDKPDEAAWYTAVLSTLDMNTGEEKIVCTSDVQLALPSGGPSGRHWAAVEATCSDRMVVAGDLVVCQSGGESKRVGTNNVDITHLEWRDENKLVYIGHRGFETVIGEYDVRNHSNREIWSSEEQTSGFWYPHVTPYGTAEAAFIAEGYLHPPRLVVSENGSLKTIYSFSSTDTENNLREGLYGDRVEKVVWTAADGLEIHGWLILPEGNGPFPTIMEVHGGPVWSNRNRWMSGVRAEPQAFVHRGYAVFRPNPRGSGGRGQSFAQQVVGDMGGKDTQDLLSGLDHLVDQGYTDPSKIGVMGVSYGGFMSSWIITQDSRFAASIPISPVTNWVSMQWTTNVPRFVRHFLDNAPEKPNGLYHGRSPVNFVNNVSTPTLVVVGDLDRISVPSQGVEFFRALREHGIESALVSYPEEGHNLRSMPATIDGAARFLSWFDYHIMEKTENEA